MKKQTFISCFRPVAIILLHILMILSFVMADKYAHGQCLVPSSQLCQNDFGCASLYADQCITGICVNNFCCFAPMPNCCGTTRGSCQPDNLVCTETVCERQNVANGCIHVPIPGCCDTQEDCNDNDFCTIDICQTDLTCWNYFIPGCCHTVADCADGLICTDDICYQEQGCDNPVKSGCCATDADCEDADLCTNDICSSPGTANGCTYPPVDCDDELPCTDDACTEDACVHTPVTCDDENACTRDFCELSTGNCFNYFDCTLDLLNCCDDNDICTRDGCNNNGACSHTSLHPTVNLGADRTVYKGYTPLSCTTLDAAAATSGGVSPFTFAWSNGSATSSINVCPAATTTYCVTVTDENGCESSDCITVCVLNVSCGNKKVNICHRNANGTFNTLCVSANLVPGHLGHGDKLGRCGQVCAAASKTAAEENNTIERTENETLLKAYPNPFTDKLNIEFTLGEDSKVKFEIFSVTGQRLATLFEGDVKAAEQQRFEYNPATGCDCMVIYRLQTEQGMYYGKAVMVR